MPREPNPLLLDLSTIVCSCSVALGPVAVAVWGSVRVLWMPLRRLVDIVLLKKY